MAKKKRVKRAVKTGKFSRAAKNSARRVVVKPTTLARSSQRKIVIVVKNLVLFAILSLISWLLYSVSNVEMYENLFLLLAYILGFTAVAFLIVLFVLLLLRLIRK